MNINERIDPNCVKEEPCKTEAFVKLWALSYKVTGYNNYEGLAVVSAIDVDQAIQIFKKDSMHNGKPEAIKIGRIDQIPYPIVPTLIMENYIKVFE